MLTNQFKFLTIKIHKYKSHIIRTQSEKKGKKEMHGKQIGHTKYSHFRTLFTILGNPGNLIAPTLKRRISSATSPTGQQ